MAAKVDIPDFVPRQGVQIETDPKATSSKPAAAGDDMAIIEGMISDLQVCWILNTSVDCLLAITSYCIPQNVCWSDALIILAALVEAPSFMGLCLRYCCHL